MSGACTVTTVRPLPSTCRLEPRSAAGTGRPSSSTTASIGLPLFVDITRFTSLACTPSRIVAAAASEVTASLSAVHWPASAPSSAPSGSEIVPPGPSTRRGHRSGRRNRVVVRAGLDLR